MSTTSNFALPGLMALDAPVAGGTPEYSQLNPHRAEDPVWEGIPAVGPVLINGEPPELPALSAELILRHELNKTSPIVLTSEDGDISIEDPSTWCFSIPPKELVLIPGPWHWKFRVTTDNGTKTYYEGVLPVLP